VFWDIGSNLGMHALTVAKLHPDARVCAFEPNPAMHALIREAAKRNTLSVEVMDVALDAAAGIASFYLHGGNAGRSSLHNWEGDPALATIEVITARGDEIVASSKAPAPHVMKIDVEGNEQRVLQGMPGLLADRKLHTVVFEDSLEETSGTKTLLRNHGFIIEPLVRLEATHHALANFVARREQTG
jgi:FkbM family methyltransferase